MATPRSSSAAGSAKPAVTVLMATYNGMPWVPEQVASILAQERVDVTLVVSDDSSTDGTREWLAGLGDARLRVLPTIEPSGSAARNFFRLLRDVDVADNEYVALADQDDTWSPDKLATAVTGLAAHDADGWSCDVMAFFPDGHEALIRKSFPQRAWDYLFEGPGPGSTFLMTPRLVRLVKDSLAANPQALNADHDWLIYAVCRARGWRWHIDAAPRLRYRQHGDNVMGANAGIGAARQRLRLIRSHWHRNQAKALAEIALTIDGGDPALAYMRQLLADTGLRARLALARRASSLRRRPRDQWILGALIAGGIW